MKPAVLSVFLCLLGALTGFEPSALLAQQSSENVQSGIRIVIANGQNGTNIVSQQSAVQPVVEILDNKNQPLPGAVVRFTAPKSGPTVRFANGEETAAVVADLKGMASVSGMVPVGTGPFRLDITAEYDDQMATAQLSQTNYASVAASGQPVLNNSMASGGEGHRGLSRGAKIGILLAVVAGAAAGIAIGLHGGSKKSSTSIGVGTPTVGAP